MSEFVSDFFLLACITGATLLCYFYSIFLVCRNKQGKVSKSKTDYKANSVQFSWKLNWDEGWQYLYSSIMICMLKSNSILLIIFYLDKYKLVLVFYVCAFYTPSEFTERNSINWMMWAISLKIFDSGQTLSYWCFSSLTSTQKIQYQQLKSFISNFKFGISISELIT